MKVGLVGWRGMVGSVLMQRMVEENDFAHIEPFTSLPVMQVVKLLHLVVRLPQHLWKLQTLPV
ncbi:semialdehyde dehydrogenase, NAD binding domain protein [Acinetobacter baumannii 1546444]|nr:semialdehyde dehydrogenase, NAD binding domain protein [Acinetobacter baumannii 1546444]